MGAIYTITIFLLVLGIMIFFHELGHYLTAKWAGVKVLEFALGMGPKIYGFTRGDTEYKLCAIPVGGYVKMLGEEPGETDDEAIDPEEADRAFVNQPPYKRIAITAAGPALNIVMAIILAPMIYLIGIDVPAYSYEKPTIVGVDENSAAGKAGFMADDEIVEAGGEKFDTWKDLNIFVALNPGKTYDFTVLRDGKRIVLNMTIGRDEKHGIGEAGLLPYLKAINAVGGFSPISPAKEAGMKVGDRIVKIEGVEIKTWDDIVANIRDSGNDRSLKIDVIRGDKPMTFNIIPKYDEGLKAYLIGIGPRIDFIHVKYPFFKAVGAGMNFLIEQLAIAGIAIKKLITGELGRKALGGPVEIAVQMGSAARRGFSSLIQLTAIISVWLGVINLFPFPALDGGHILFSIVEIISRRKLNQRVLDVMNTVGFAMLMTLILFVTLQDIDRHWHIIDFFKNLFS